MLAALARNLAHQFRFEAGHGAIICFDLRGTGRRAARNIARIETKSRLAVQT
jgi:hypothetical protein